MLPFGKTTALVPTKKMPPWGPTVKEEAARRDALVFSDSDGRLDVMHVGLSSVVRLNRAGGEQLRLIGSLSPLGQVPFAQKTSVSVDVASVPGEHNTDNNKATFPVIFSLG